MGRPHFYVDQKAEFQMFGHQCFTAKRLCVTVLPLALIFDVLCFYVNKTNRNNQKINRKQR
jgi:hypothetical protein